MAEQESSQREKPKNEHSSAGSVGSGPSPRLATSPSMSELSSNLSDPTDEDAVSAVDTDEVMSHAAGDDDETLIEPEDEDLDDEEKMTPEERLEAEREKVAQCKETITSLIEQITAYRRIVEEEKERDKKKISQMLEMLEKQKQITAEMELRAEEAAGDEVLQQKIKQLTHDLEEEKAKTTELRVQTVANLKALQADLLNIDETNKSLNKELSEERAAHKQTIQQLWALKQRAESPMLAVQDQEVRLRLTIDGNRITQAVLIPENDEARAALKEENDFLKGKFLELQQEHNIMRSELEEAKNKSVDAEKLAEKLKQITAEHESLTTQLEEVTKQRDAFSSQATSLQQRFNSKLKQEETSRIASLTPLLQKEAARIFDRYCIDNAPYEVQLSKQVKQKIFQAINGPSDVLTVTLFDQARAEIVQLLESDLFVRWISAGSWKMSWKKPEKPSFNEMFGNREVRKDFHKFIEHEMAVEHMLFLIDVEEYSQMTPEKAVSPSIERRHHHRSKTSSRNRTISLSEDPKSARSKKHESMLSVQVNTITSSETSPGNQTKQLSTSPTNMNTSPQIPEASSVPPIPPLPGAVNVTTNQQNTQTATNVTAITPPIKVTVPPLTALSRFPVLPPPVTDDTLGEEPSTSSSAKRRSSSPTAPEPIGSAKRGSISARELGENYNINNNNNNNQADLQAGQDGRKSAELHRTISDGRKTIRKQARFSVIMDSSEKLTAVGASEVGGDGNSSNSSSNSSSTTSIPVVHARTTSEGRNALPSALNMFVGLSSPEKTSTTTTTGSGIGVRVTSNASSNALALKSPTNQNLKSPSGATLGSSTREQYMHNLQQLVNDVNPIEQQTTNRRLETSFIVLGAVSYILPVRSNVWIANGSSPCTIQIYDRENCNLKSDIIIGASVTQMLLTDRIVWTTTTEKSILCFDTKDPKIPKQLSGHSKGPIFGIEKAGRYVWTIAADQNIGIWDAKDMKLHKLISSGSFMTCLLNVGEEMWVGTSLGIVYYDQTTFKPIKKAVEKKAEAPKTAAEPTTTGALAASTMPSKTQKMSVSKLILVDKEVWAVNHDDNQISVWDIATKSIVATIEAKRVRDLIYIGPLVWTCSWDNTIKCWDVKTRQFVRELSGIHDDTITCLSLAKSTNCLRVWSGSADHTVCIWNSDYQTHEMTEHPGSRTGICPVCNKSLRGIGQKVCVCKACMVYAVHRRCVDGIPMNAICPEASPIFPGVKPRKDSTPSVYQ